ncbi:putative vacuolar cation/proton exchanger 2 [Xylogone sp. PMI_703]|nr:putative vacuolar cation/proton exchanger 2 [Xylogone sp. PMI_703]
MSLHRLRSTAGAEAAEQGNPATVQTATEASSSSEKPAKEAGHHHHGILPTFNHNGHKVTKGIKPEGESGRQGFHPGHFFRIVGKSTSKISMMVNILWPVVPAAIAVRYARPEWHIASFTLNYIAMVPCANLIGFAGQELARKLPKVFGVLLETTLGSVVEIILFMVLLNNNEFEVIKAAILGSVLATQLLCLGLCFFAGGMRREEQQFNEIISEVGNGLLLTAGLGIVVPTAFYLALQSDTRLTAESLDDKVLHISRITSVLLIIAFATYVWFQMRTHHGIFDEILELDELRDEDRHIDLKKDKLTFTECAIALTISIALVTIIAINLVKAIPHIISHGVSDSFLGLILVPLVEKAAEHLTAIDEAWDNQMNFALAHVLGATIQTSLFNGPLVVIVGWGLDKAMDLNFELFNIVILILTIIVVGNFLKDQKSNYLEGALCVIVYVNIAVAAWYYPNPVEGSEDGGEGINGTESGAGEAAVEAAARLVRMML